MVVLAKVYTDDHAVEAQFDAEPYLVQATDADIQRLIGCEWGGDEPADDVAYYFENCNAEIKAVFAYLYHVRGLRSHKDCCGFECYIDQNAAEAWVRQHRPHCLANHSS